MSYLLHLAVYLCIYVILAASLNLVVGYCGKLSLAHATFFAAGAYTYALLTAKAAWGFFPALIMAFTMGAVLSLFLSIPSWRLKDDVFVLISLALQTLTYNLILNWHDPTAEIGSLRNLTNGLFGIGGIPRPVIFGIRFDTINSITVLSGILTFLVLGITAILIHSPWGRVLQAMRDDELAARGLGKDTRILKTQAMLIASGFAAVAGVIYAGYVGYVDPSLSSLNMSMLLLAMLLVGGSGNFLGPAVGAAVLLAIPELLRMLNIPDAQAGELRLLAYGLLIVLFVHLRPVGLAGSYRME
jgi:branched-chain amino acid transport system permease protein